MSGTTAPVNLGGSDADSDTLTYTITGEVTGGSFGTIDNDSGLVDFAATLTKGAHIEVEGSLSSRERTIETNEGVLAIRTFSVKAESIRKLDRAERESTGESSVGGRIEP